MVKLSTHLKLVSDDGQPAGSGRLELVSFSQVSSHEQERIQKAVQAIGPGAGIIGVMRGARTWDLRPVLMYFGETGPSLLRLLGPEVSLSSAVTERARGFLHKSAALYKEQEIGIYEGQLWYRRPLYDKTLASLLSEGAVPSPSVALKISASIIEELGRLHAAGLIHGHLVPANIAVLAPNKVKLTDPGTGIFVIQATRELAIEEFPQGYVKESFAPEIMQDGSLSYSTDIFGLGLTLRELFSSIKNYLKNEKIDFGGEVNEHDLQAVIDFTHKMTASNAFERPTLENVRSVIVNFGRPEFGKSALNPNIKESTPVDPRINEASVKEVLVKEQAPVAKVQSTAPVRDDQPQTPQAQPGASAEVNEEPAKKKKRRRRRNRNRNNQSAENNQSQGGGNFETQGEQYQQSAQPTRESLPLNTPAPRAAEVNTSQQMSQLEQNFQSRPATPPRYNVLDERLAEEIRWTEDNQKFSAASVDNQVKTQNTAGFVYIVMGALAAFLLYFVWNNLQPTTTVDNQIAMSRDELKMAWDSRLPSRMSIVAKAALNKGDLSKSAELIIVSAAQSGEELYGVDVSLLRIAFDDRWEKDLKETDRHTALALSLAGLLKGELPSDLAKPEDLHPGILLAIAGAYGQKGSKFLSKVPASVFVSLPVPLGNAFNELISVNPTMSSADPAVLALAKFATKGITSVDDIVSFLMETRDFNIRIRALAQLFSQDNVQARNLIAALLAHPNVHIDEEKIVWAKESKLYQWSELEASDQLYILAGLPPAGNVSAENLGKLFWHPTASVRGDAISRGIDKISFSHPASYAVLTALKEAPELLDAKQTIKLIHILLGYRQTKIGDIKAWLDGEPPVMLVSAMLLGTSSQAQSSQLDYELYRYLAEKKWKPTTSELKQMIKHPLALVRVVAYREAYQLENRNDALQLLLDGRKTEQDKDIRDNIEGFIRVLMNKVE